MATPNPNFTLLFILIITTFTHHFYPIYCLNITQILSNYPDLSDFTAFLTTTGISTTLSHRTSLTLLAVPNTHLTTATAATSPSALPDVIRYHVILQYLTWPDLRRLPPSGALFPTLLQTTGRATAAVSSLNLTFNPSNGVVSVQPFNTTILNLIKTVPYSVSIFAIDSLLSPYDTDLTAAASETRPPPPPGVNFTKALADGKNFNVAAAMLTASGVISEFQREESGAGVTLFVPTDSAFANIGPVQLQALPAEKKSLVLKFHVLLSYYPLGSLELITNPFMSTLATEDNGAGSFMVNISRVNGSVTIDSGLARAVVTQTVFDQNPVAIFGVSSVLLPKEIFGDRPGGGVDPDPDSDRFVGTQSPVLGPGPGYSPSVDGPARLSTPPGIPAHGWRWRPGGIGFAVFTSLACKVVLDQFFSV